jgi:pimeloyl-ACP methyl ester carboxylesterase
MNGKRIMSAFLGSVAMLAAGACRTVAPASHAAEIAQLEEKTITLPGGEVSYKDSGGKGVAIVFVHPYNKLMWDKQIPAVTKAGYRFVSFDVRSLMGQNGIDRIEALTAALGIQKFHLVGTGGAGVLGMRYTFAHGDKVRSFIATNCLVGLRDAELNEMEARLRSPQFDAMPATWRELSPTYRAVDPEGVKTWQVLAAARPVMQGAAQAASAGQAPSAGAPAATPTPAAAVAANPDPTTLARLNHLKTPFVLVTGDADLYTPPGILRKFVASIHGAEGIVIPDSSHNSQWENPDGFNSALLKYLSRP